MYQPNPYRLLSEALRTRASETMLIRQVIQHGKTDRSAIIEAAAEARSKELKARVPVTSFEKGFDRLVANGVFLIDPDSDAVELEENIHYFFVTQEKSFLKRYKSQRSFLSKLLRATHKSEDFSMFEPDLAPRLGGLLSMAVSDEPMCEALQRVGAVERAAALWVLGRYLHGESFVSTGELIGLVSPVGAERLALHGAWDGRRSPLLRTGWLERCGGNGWAPSDEVLAQIPTDLLAGREASALQADGIIRMRPEAIAPTDLIFDPDLDAVQRNVASAIDGFESHAERLGRFGLPPQLIVLLEGLPGTGKTEWVRQVARRSERELIQVDASSLRSMWWGESEKQVTRLFRTLDRMHRESARTPVILLNEVDGMLFQRTNPGASHNTERVMMTQFLEGLEGFQGILVATTNDAGAMDDAFDRRFGLKLQFELPTGSAAEALWMSTFKWKPNRLPLAARLAQDFRLSPGAIRNVLRKSLLSPGGHLDEAQIRQLAAAEQASWGNRSVRKLKTMGYAS